MQLRTAALLAILSLPFLSACASGGGGREAQPGDRWILARVELDRSAVQHPERRFPIFDPPAASSFGQRPYAVGDLGINQEGRVAVTSYIADPMSGGRFRKDPLLTFTGLFDTDGVRVINASIQPSGVRKSTATEITVVLEDELLKVQGFWGNERHPYILYFQRSATPPRPVVMPTR